MGRIRTKDIKDLARDLHAAYPERFASDFEQNKQALKDLKIVEGKSKRFRNRVAGYVVRLARQAAHGHHAAGERAPEPVAETVEQEIGEQLAAGNTEAKPAEEKEEE